MRKISRECVVEGFGELLDRLKLIGSQFSNIASPFVNSEEVETCLRILLSSTYSSSRKQNMRCYGIEAC